MSRGTHIILGCGYTGLVMARKLAERGDVVVGTSRNELRKSDIEAVGAKFAVFNLDEDEPLPRARPTSITVLAPPPGEDDDRNVERLKKVADKAPGCPILVVISTAIYGDTRGTITERTHPAPRSEREKRWALMDAAAMLLRGDGHDIRVIRTPAIYGPGRDFRASLLTGNAKVVRPAPPTSRIHVEDLANLLIRMTEPHGPPMLLACDELPSPTWRVMAEAARLLDQPAPLELTPEQAADHFSEVGLEMRLGGHQCMSLVRPYLRVRLRYPTYREGLRACLLGDVRS
jgi:nucleoside-diphosphate-sugar epimerase